MSQRLLIASIKMSSIAKAHMYALLQHLYLSDNPALHADLLRLGAKQVHLPIPTPNHAELIAHIDRVAMQAANSKHQL